MTSPIGHTEALPLAQRYLGDLGRLALQAPMATVQRTALLTEAAAARACAAPRPHWSAVFTKALAFVAAAQPELRQIYLPYPHPRLYEHPCSVAAVLVERPLDEDVPALWARLRNPGQLGLLELDALLRRFKEEPADRVGQVRRIRSRSVWPSALRRLAWWRDAGLSGRRRARRLGTFAVASVGQWGTDLVDPLYPATAVLTYGAIDASGPVALRLKFDARVLTPGVAARILQDVERTLTCEVLLELRYFQQLDAA
jgi:hypothetical protein